MRLYNDSKELTAHIYERIKTTKDFRFMIKGYEIGDEVECDLEDLEAKFKAIVQDYVICMNNKSLDIKNMGEYARCQLEISLLELSKTIIVHQLRINLISSELSIKNVNFVKELLEDFKIEKTDDLTRQMEIIDNRINKLQNELNKAESNLNKEGSNEVKEELCISEIVANLIVILGVGIDTHKTSIFQVGKYLELANKKQEQLINKK